METNTVFVYLPRRLASTTDEIFWRKSCFKGRAAKNFAGGCDLTSPAGKMTMGVIAAVAQFEKDLLIERTLAGQTRAKAEGKRSSAVQRC